MLDLSIMYLELYFIARPLPASYTRDLVAEQRSAISNVWQSVDNLRKCVLKYRGKQWGHKL